MDRQALKIEHYKQRVAEYEERFADLRIEITEYVEEIGALRERIAELEKNEIAQAEVFDGEVVPDTEAE